MITEIWVHFVDELRCLQLLSQSQQFEHPQEKGEFFLLACLLFEGDCSGKQLCLGVGWGLARRQLQAAILPHIIMIEGHQRANRMI
jgi:hypothetical protein